MIKRELLYNIDIPFLCLFCISSLTFLGVEISMSQSLVISMLLTIYLFIKRVECKGKYAMVISPVSILLILNLLFNNCGIGAIIGYLELLLILLLTPHLRINKINFTILFYVAFCILLCFAYRITLHPEMMLPEDVGGEGVNQNMVGIFMFYMTAFIILFYPRKNVWNSLIAILSLAVSAFTIWLSECRSAQGAIVIIILGTLYINFKKKEISNSLLNFECLIALILLFGGIFFVYMSIGTTDVVLHLIGDVSDLFGNRKGATLSTRGDIWVEALNAFYQSPFIGTGSTLKIKSYSENTLALHNSTLNILVVYGVFIYIITIFHIRRLIVKVKNTNFHKNLLFLGISVYCGVLLISYFESNLMDYFKLYSMMPLIFSCSISNLREGYE